MCLSLLCRQQRTVSPWRTPFYLEILDVHIYYLHGAEMSNEKEFPWAPLLVCVLHKCINPSEYGSMLLTFES